METRFRSLMGVAAFLLLIAVTPVQLAAQCVKCGDLDSSGTIVAIEFIHIMDFLYGGEPINAGCADVDNRDLITIADAMYLNVHVFQGGPAPICPPGGGRIIPPPTPNYRIEYDRQIPAFEPTPKVLFRIRNQEIARCIAFGFQIKLDGVHCPVDSVKLITVNGGGQHYRARLYPAGGPGDSVSVGLLNAGSTIEPGTTNLFTAYLSAGPSPNPRSVRVEYLDMPPYMEDEFGVPTPVNYTMILDLDKVAWGLDSSSCQVWYAGDTNDDQLLTSSDLITLVNFVFKSGPDPLPCTASGDTDCSGGVSSADLILMVNHLFKGGPAFCDVCNLIPGTWSCP